MVGLMSPACLAAQPATRTVTILGAVAVLPAQDGSTATTVTTTAVPAAPPKPDMPLDDGFTQPLSAAPVMSADLALYLMKNTPPDELIRYVWRDESPATIEHALVIACREGGMGKGSGATWQVACSPSHRHAAVPYDPSCGADNPTSSASGLVQFMGSWRGWGGFDWELIRSRDCLEDVLMFYAAWKANGWQPWRM